MTARSFPHEEPASDPEVPPRRRRRLPFLGGLLIGIGLFVGGFFCLVDRVPRGAHLVVELRSPEVAVRRRAAQAIGSLSGPDEILRMALVEGLGDPDSEVRRWCCRGLERFGSSADLPPLEAKLADPQTPVRRAAAFSLLRLDPANPSAQKELTSAMKTGDGGVILALTSWEPAPEWAAPTLVALLKDRRPGLRRLAADALGHVGKAAPAAVPALQNASKDADDRVRAAASEAIARLRR